MKPQKHEERRYQAFKVSTSNHERRDYQMGLTIDEVQKHPAGKHQDALGTYFWSYSLMRQYIN